VTGCSVDVAAWQEQNRVELFPGQTNRWTLCRTLRDHPSDSDILDSLGSVFAFWFGDWSTELVDPRLPRDPPNELYIGPAEGLRVVAHAPGPYPPPPPEGWGSPLKTRDEIVGVAPSSPPPWPWPNGPQGAQIVMWTPGECGVVYLEVEFVWRSPEANAPWPVYSRWPIVPHLLEVVGSCPVLADWALWRVFPAAKDPPPAPRSQVERAVAGAARIAAPLDLTLPVIGIASLAAIGVTAAVVAYWPPRRKVPR
jgi:hypothetical protein